jgi:hypothetical protein
MTPLLVVVFGINPATAIGTDLAGARYRDRDRRRGSRQRELCHAVSDGLRRAAAPRPKVVP